MLTTHKKTAFFFALFMLNLSAFGPAHGDVMKPALIEVSAFTNGQVEIEVRASIEAIMADIGSEFKNTAQSPNAGEYDRLRVMKSNALRAEFQPFYSQVETNLALKIDGNTIPLKIVQVVIPPAGYTKVPRLSMVVLKGKIPKTAKTLDFIYPLAYSQSAVRVRQIDKVNEKWHWSSWQWRRKPGDATPFPLGALFKQPSTFQVITDYIKAGYDHILPKGMDHILFILGLFLFSAKLSPLLWQVTMFTVAHTITLGLAMSGWITLPPRIVEPLIALSIVFVGFENIYTTELKKSRLALIFGFGLLHGLGFASMLADFGMPAGAFFTALISFNIGVELGQLTVLLLAFGLVAYWFRGKPALYRQWVVIPASVVICCIALYWFFERLELF